MTSDIKKNGWIKKLPILIQPYAILGRFDRPIGIWLLVLPGWWGIALASDPVTQNLWIFILFLIGAAVMRAAGCVVNDIWDRNLDKNVARTQDRPIANGDISLRQAVFFLTVLCLIGLVILLQFNRFTMMLGFLCLPLITVYPLMKRITWWPQLFLGLTFNFSTLMGWSAVMGSVSLIPCLLYISAIFWTLAYDTIYAHQDKEDDALIGIKSAALRLGGASRKAIIISTMMQYGLLSAAFVLATEDFKALMLFIPIGLYNAWIIKKWNMDDAQNCLKTFKASRDIGMLILLVILLVQL